MGLAVGVGNDVVGGVGVDDGDVEHDRFGVGGYVDAGDGDRPGHTCGYGAAVLTGIEQPLGGYGVES